MDADNRFLVRTVGPGLLHVPAIVDVVEVSGHRGTFQNIKTVPDVETA
jgi:hypothetical protein